MDAFDEKCPVCFEANNDPVIKKEKMCAHFVWYRQLLFFVTGWLGFQVIGNIFTLLFTLMGLGSSALINFTTYILLCSAMVALVWTDSKEIFKSFKSWKPFVFGILGYIVIIILSNGYELITSTILNILHITPSVNQNEVNVRGVTQLYPFISLIVFGVIGPLCEEFTYRVGLFGFTRRVNIVFAFIVTTLLFALIHFKDETILDFIFHPSDDTLYLLIIEIVNLPSYMIAGFVFTFLYYKWGFASSVTAHIANNSIIIILSTIERWLGGLLGA